MATQKQSTKKLDLLREQSVLNIRADKVKAELFHEHSFFDSNDMVQVKYEMLRSVLKDGSSVSSAADEFGFSRPTFYQTLKNFKKKGIVGFIPERPGPKDAHKLKKEIMSFIKETQGFASVFKHRKNKVLQRLKVISIKVILT